tara:strand:- start:2 stop:559 length:558 start_codon:yes stop_codon:yes gene_type:complete
MSLDDLSKEIIAQAEARAKSILDDARAEAESIRDEAVRRATETTAIVEAKAARDSEQISTELVAAAKQANQKRALVARKEELDLTWDTVKQEVSSINLDGRDEILQGLIEEVKSQTKEMIMRPVEIDRKFLSSSKFEMGENISGLGGFVLESKDGAVVLDYRFDSLLENAWKSNMASVNEILFGE